MKQATRDRLNALNLRFYGGHAHEFSATRARPWRGSARALAHAAAALDGADAVASEDRPSLPVRVLDVGCGNGRLIAALRERFGGRLEYTGVDASEPLLQIARARASAPGIQFTTGDFVAAAPETALPTGPFELVALLGVLHHVPGEQARCALIRAAAARLAPAGVLVLSLWRFERSPRLSRRLLPPDARARRLEQLAIDAHDLEPGDQLLAWGDDDAVRYCHFVDDDERARLLRAANLPPLADFRADGEGDALNDYVLLRAP